MSSTIFTKQDFTLGALFRLAAKRRLPRGVVETLMVERARLPLRVAKQLAGHWFTTIEFREAR
jgi:hypothetical protein